MSAAKLVAKLDLRGDIAAEKIIAKLAKLGKAAVPALLEAAKNAELASHARQWSLLALGTIGDRRAIPVLFEALEHPNMPMRLQALKGLRRMKLRKASAKIVKLLDDKSGGIRVNALYALAELGDRKAGKAVIKALDDPQWYVRQNACVACGKLKLLEARRKLLLLQKKDEKKAVRLAAGTALEALDPQNRKLRRPV